MTTSSTPDDDAIDLWGGIECTLNRVGDTVYDQLERSGHENRISDLNRFAHLGLRTLRYPFLWEKLAPRGPARADWTWADHRWREFQRLGTRVIAGLVHHGSGPPGTNLLEEHFVTGLVAYAGAFARRYPHADAYTPINEPCTTARFSALHGYWYPHYRTDQAFVRALLVQCRATVLAMRAIRRVNSAARLVQTEDLGRTFSTAPLAYQAEFQNERRWLALDLVGGRVTRDHPLWSYLLWAGASEGELRWFADHPCPPDVIGVNYYLTSDRFLDHRLARYPQHLHGGNGRDAYADTEAVRVRNEGLVGHARILLEASERYRRPVALTEVHAGGTVEDQVSWLVEGWTGALVARSQGADVIAVTIWALLGSYDWDSLVTKRRDYYEPGAFDVQHATPRITAVGRWIRTFRTSSSVEMDRSSRGGWWRSPERLLTRTGIATA
jgi:dTDP-4-dehydrorhamnose reductase